MDVPSKIKVLLAYRDMSLAQLAKRMGISQQYLSKKMRVNSFKEAELQKIAEICNATFEGTFILNDMNKII